MSDSQQSPALDPGILDTLADWELLPTLADDDPDVVIEHPILSEDGECFLVGRTYAELKVLHNALSGYIEFISCIHKQANERMARRNKQAV